MRPSKRDRNSRNLKPIKYIFLLTGVLFFSTLVSFVLLAVVFPAGQSSPVMSVNAASGGIDYRNLFQHYKLLHHFLHLPVSEEGAPEPAQNENSDPFIRDILVLQEAAANIKDKQYSRAAAVLKSVNANPRMQHPYIIQKKETLAFELLWYQKKYSQFITRWEQLQKAGKAPRSRRYRQFLLGSYINVKRNDDAFALFKTLFATGSLKTVSPYISGSTLTRFLGKLEYDYWYEKFKFLARNNRYSEFLRERRYAAAPQLRTLFYAEFLYRQKRYSQCRKYLRQVTSPRLDGYKRRILLKLELRADNFARIFQDLDHMSGYRVTEPDIYLEVLVDAGSISLIKGKTAIARQVFARYVDTAEQLHLAHTFNLYQLLSGEGPLIQDSNYWKLLWLQAWLDYRDGQTETAARFFRKGTDSPIITYKVANSYWLGQVGKKKDQTTAASPELFPLTYYYTKDRELNSPNNGLDAFVRLMDRPRGPYLDKAAGHIRTMIRANLQDEAIGFIRWLVTEQSDELSVSDTHTLMLTESIIYLKKGNYAMAFIRFRDNFQCYRCMRLPHFLREIAFPAKYTDLIDRYGGQHNIDRAIVLSLIREESFFRPDARSYANAHGLMQLLLKTARQMARPQKLRVNRRDLYNPEINIRLGTAYLRFLLDKYDNKMHLALAAYNAGDHRVDRWLEQFGSVTDDEFIEMIPFSATRSYVKNILRNYYYYRLYYEN